jgi:hypothetical protein
VKKGITLSNCANRRVLEATVLDSKTKIKYPLKWLIILVAKIKLATAPERSSQNCKASTIHPCKGLEETATS